MAWPVALIELERLHLPAAGGQLQHGGQCTLLPGSVGEPHPVTVPGKPLHGGSTDPARTSGDQHAARHRQPTLQQAHRSQLGPGRTTAEKDPTWIDAQLSGVAVQPEHTLAHHRHDLVQAVLRSEAIAQRGEGAAAGHEVRRGEGRLRLTQFLPVTTVDEDMQGRPGPARRKEVQHFGVVAPVVQRPPRQQRPGLR